jgi:hypothetical protein
MFPTFRIVPTDQMLLGGPYITNDPVGMLQQLPDMSPCDSSGQSYLSPPMHTGTEGTDVDARLQDDCD